MRRSALYVAAAGAALLSACQQTAPPVTEAHAAKAFDATVAVWESQDAARIKALYAPDVAGFGLTGPLVTDRAAWDQAQEQFAAAKIDKVAIEGRKIQLLGPDAFIVSSVGEDTSSYLKAGAAFRCTDVFKRQTDGRWLIVNENCSSLLPAS